MDRTFEDVNRDIASALASGNRELHKDLLLEEKQLLLLEKKELEVEKWKRRCCELTVELRDLKVEMEAKLVRAVQSAEGRAEERRVAELTELATELRSDLKEVVREHFRSQNPPEEEPAPRRFRDLFKFGKKKPSPPPLRPAT